VLDIPANNALVALKPIRITRFDGRLGGDEASQAEAG
jgi:hypothetical protein